MHARSFPVEIFKPVYISNNGVRVQTSQDGRKGKNLTPAGLQRSSLGCSYVPCIAAPTTPESRPCDHCQPFASQWRRQGTCLETNTQIYVCKKKRKPLPQQLWVYTLYSVDKDAGRCAADAEIKVAPGGSPRADTGSFCLCLE